jgi:hypothetical protein
MLLASTIDLHLSTNFAIFLSLLAAFMWGTWFISLKYLGHYPLDGFFLTVYLASLILVWGVGIGMEGSALFANIREVYQLDSSRVGLTFLCGALYVLGLRVSLYVFQLIGFSVAQPIQSSVNILMGTFISAVVGGMPTGLSVSRLVIACATLVAAVIFSVLAGKFRTESLSNGKAEVNLHYAMSDLWRSLGLLFLASFLIPMYTLGLSYGLRSPLQPQGLAVLPFMAVLSAGSFTGMMLSSGLLLTVRKQWGVVLNASLSIHKFGIFSAVFHYGGNIIHTFATSSLSPVISWPLGVTFGLWTQFWGIVYGEFKGAGRRAYIALGLAVIFYLLGAWVMAAQA